MVSRGVQWCPASRGLQAVLGVSNDLQGCLLISSGLNGSPGVSGGLRASPKLYSESMVLLMCPVVSWRVRGCPVASTCFYMFQVVSMSSGVQWFQWCPLGSPGASIIVLCFLVVFRSPQGSPVVSKGPMAFYLFSMCFLWCQGVSRDVQRFPKVSVGTKLYLEVCIGFMWPPGGSTVFQRLPLIPIDFRGSA